MIKKKLSIEELAGQRVMAGFDGTAMNRDLENLIGELKVGGLILFARNIEHPEQVKQLCASVQQFAKNCGIPPLFIAIDQEGGQVARLKKPLFTEFPGNPSIKDKQGAEDFAAQCAQMLLGLHINMNLAPVIDAAPEDCISIMAKRVFPGSPETVAHLGCHVIKSLQRRGIMAVAKHFPGIGRTQLDSHLELPVLDADPDLIQSSDMVPFKEACQVDVAGIMLSHVLYSGIDSVWPASLSPVIARDILRKQMGYQGLVMTDDLDMKAIKHDIKTCVRQIIQSEVDLMLICHEGPDIETAHHEIIELMSAKDDLYSKAVESWQRIRDTKERFIEKHQ